MKKTVAILLCIIMVLSFAGCAKKAEPALETAAETAVETEAVTEAPTEAQTEAPETEAPEPETEAPAPTVTSDIASRIPEKVELIHPVTVTVYQGAQDDSNRMLYNASWSGAGLEKDEQQLYPQLSAALDEGVENSKKDVLSRRDEILKDYFTPDMLEREGFEGFSMEMSSQIIRADSAFTSVKNTYFDYAGGAHPTTVISGYNYLTQDGSEIKLEDIFTDETSVISALHDKLNSDYPDAGFFNLDEDIKMYKFNPGEDDPELTWTLGYDGVTFYFNQYELAPYASGIQIVTLPFNDYPELYAQGVDCYSGNYITPLEPYTKTPYGDGFIEVDGVYGEYGFIDKIAITVNDKRFEFDNRTYSLDPYIAYKDGKYSVYVFGTSDDDDQWCDKYDIADGEVSEAGRTQGGIPVSVTTVDVDEPLDNYSCYQRVWINYVPVDPNNFQISEK